MTRNLATQRRINDHMKEWCWCVVRETCRYWTPPPNWNGVLSGVEALIEFAVERETTLLVRNHLYRRLYYHWLEQLWR